MAEPRVVSALRPPDWQSQLAAYVELHRGNRFQWGVHDCASFVRKWIAMMRPDADLQPLDAKRDRASTVYSLLTAESLIERMDRTGLRQIAPVLSRRGDIVLIVIKERETLALHCGQVAIAPGEFMLEFVRDPFTARAAWAV